MSVARLAGQGELFGEVGEEAAEKPKPKRGTGEGRGRFAHHCAKCGLPGHNSTWHDRWVRALDLHAQGVVPREIAATIGMHPTALNKWLRRAGVPPETAAGKPRHCTVCGEKGHRATFHDPNWVNPRKGEVRHCSVCGDSTHNAVVHRVDAGSKLCANCGGPLPLDRFHRRERTTRRWGKVEYYSSLCKECDKSVSKRRYHGEIAKRLAYRMQSVRARCRKEGWICDFDVSYLEELFEKQGGRCYYSGRPMTLETGKDSVSVDRVDASKPYSRANVVLCQWRVNDLKNNIPARDFYELCRDIARTCAPIFGEK